MQNASRLILTAAVAGAALLLPLAAAAPAHADGIPTSATLKITTSAGTVVEGDQAGFTVLLVENAGGQPTGLTGRIDVEATRNGTSVLSFVRPVNAPNQVWSLPIDTSTPGGIQITARFVEATENETGASGSASMVILGKASVSVQTTSVHAGDTITPVVDLPAGSVDADGRMQATAPGMPTLVCGPAVTSSTSRACPLEVPKDLPSGRYTMTFTYGASPEYADASTTEDIQVIGNEQASTSSSTGSQTGTSTTVTRTSSGSGSTTVARTSSGSGVTTVGAGGVGLAAGSTAAGSDTTDSTPAPDATPTTMPTEVAAPLPVSKPVAAGPVAATSASVLTMLPMLIPFAAAGLIGLLLVVLLIVLLVRRARRAA